MAFPCRAENLALPDDPGTFGLRGGSRRFALGLVSFNHFGRSWLRNFCFGSRENCVFEKQLLAFAAKQQKFKDFRENALANLAGGGMLGTFYRAG